MPGDPQDPGVPAPASGERLCALLEHAPDAVFLADPDGRCTDVNEAGCRMLGAARDQVVGRSLLEFIPEEDAPRFEASKQRLKEQGTDISEWKLRRADGTLLDVEVSARMLEGGGWQGLVRDISERRRLTEELVRSRADLDRAQEVARTGSWRLDVHRNELIWSDESYRIFGVRPGTPMSYERFLACVHPDDRGLVDREWNAALRGKPYDIEHRVVVGGESRWVRERADLEFDERGALIGGIGTTQDVDDQHRLREQLAALEERSRAIVSMSPTAIVTVDDGQRITSFNRAAEDVFGWKESEVVGETLDLLLPPRFRAIHRRAVRGFAAGPVARREMRDHVPIRGLRKDGEEFPAEGSIARVESGGEQILMVLLRDVTEQVRQLEEETFLSEVGAILPESMDPALTVVQIGQLAVRTLADFCVVDLAVPGAGRLSAFVRDPAHRGAADRLERSLRHDPPGPLLVSTALASEVPFLLAEIDVADLPDETAEDQHLLRQLAPRSLVGAPLVARRKRLGALVLGSARRRYDQRDLRLAQELAARAALALDNAGLLRAAEDANAALRETVERLEAAQRTIRNLTELLPVCAWCGKVRDDEAGGRWMGLEEYLQQRTQVTHGMCPDCARRFGVPRAPSPA